MEPSALRINPMVTAEPLGVIGSLARATNRRPRCHVEGARSGLRSGNNSHGGGSNSGAAAAWGSAHMPGQPVALMEALAQAWILTLQLGMVDSGHSHFP